MAVVWVELGGGEGGAVVCVEGGGGEGRAGKTGDTTGLGVTELMGDSGRATCEVHTATVMPVNCRPVKCGYIYTSTNSA